MFFLYKKLNGGYHVSLDAIMNSKHFTFNSNTQQGLCSFRKNFIVSAYRDSMSTNQNCFRIIWVKKAHCKQRRRGVRQTHGKSVTCMYTCRHFEKKLLCEAKRSKKGGRKTHRLLCVMCKCCYVRDNHEKYEEL